MFELWTVAFPILLVDVANPVLLASVIICATTNRPILHPMLLILGHSLSYLVFGLVLAYGLADVIEELLQPFWLWINNPEPIDFVIGLLIGVALVWAALRWKTSPPDTSEKAPDPTKLKAVSYLMFGIIVNFIGLPFALPYFAFLNQLLKQDDSLVLPNLFIYNGLYALPFLLVPITIAVFGKTILPLLEKVNEAVDRFAAYIMPVALAVLGVLMIIDALLFFATGSGLI